MKRARQSYPLTLIFMTVFVASILMVAVSAVGPSYRSRTWDFAALPASAIGCGVLAGIVGAMIGMHCFDRPKRFAGGGLIGFLTGLTIGPMILVNQAGIDQVFLAQIGGAAALLVFALVSVLNTKDHLWDQE